MKRKTENLFEDRHGIQRQYDPEDASGRQTRYPAKWIDGLPAESPARVQHEGVLRLYRKVHDFIEGHDRLQEFFDSGPVDGSGFRDLYSEHTHSFASGEYATDLVEWVEMLQTIVGLIDLEYSEDDDEGERFYFDEEACKTLTQPLWALEEEVTNFLETLKRLGARGAQV